MIKKDKESLEKQLSDLINQVGGDFAAARMIKKVKGAAPHYTTLMRAKNGSYNEYSIRSMIADIKKGLKNLERSRKKRGLQ